MTGTIRGCDVETSSDPISVFVDSDAPIPSCSFGVGIGIESTGSSTLVDPELSYSVLDNCPDLPMSMSVEIFSNELEDFNSQKIAILYEQDSGSGGINTKCGTYLASSACSTRTNGQCIRDPKLDGTRLYMARIRAKDQAGLTASVECYVQVIENGKEAVPLPGVSTQRFLIQHSETNEYLSDGMLID